MQSYEAYVGHLETGVLNSFLSDWDITSYFSDTCNDYDYDQCYGDNYCRVESSFLEDFIDGGCQSVSGSCLPTITLTECENKFDESLSSEFHGKLSIRNIIEEMEVSLELAIKLFGRLLTLHYNYT